MKKHLSAILLVAMMLIASFAGAQVVTSAQGFTVSAPAVLINSGSVSKMSDTGSPYVLTTYTTELSNGDIYEAAAAVYTVTLDAPKTTTDAFNAATAGYTILVQRDLMVSGIPAKFAVVRTANDSVRLGYLVVVKGNTIYQFVTAGNPTVAFLPNESPNTFFNSVVIN